jgi:50S ribosomal protein L16 3-hydroxylase
LKTIKPKSIEAIMTNTLTHIGQTPVQQFMQEDWHTRPRLFKQAFPNLEPLCDFETIFDMASDEDIESRLVRKTQEGWDLERGPFEALPSLDEKNWTVLVQGIDHHLPEAYDLLQQFRFIPDARLDDIMLSLASDQGGVGPHYDSYDVFLIQMHGKRRWKIGPLPEKEIELLDNCPLKILKNFEPTEEFVLEPGDMLYLPPKYGHDGVAEGICSTISVGFRSPSKAEILAGLLRDFADHVENDEHMKSTLFSDPKRKPQTTPAEIPEDMLNFACKLFDDFSADSCQISRSLGKLLTEPKPHVYFINNTEEMTASEILETLRARGIALSMKTKMLFNKSRCYINGEEIEPCSASTLKQLQDLANQREMPPHQAKEALQNKEFQYFLIGFAKAGWVETLI